MMQKQYLENSVAGLTDTRPEVIRAANIETKQLSDLFARAAESEKWRKAASQSLVAALIGWGGLFAGSATQHTGLSTIGVVIMIAGIAGNIYGNHLRRKHSVDKDVKEIVENRLLELDSKDRGQPSAPRLQ
ncbi:MAG: hypothetical protein H6867_11370 [Rhodospirillales bacterium]|nr:hypothetical protein [Rhodospirillales bacterium]MCB9996729.1 hypothetical protein [Rhodospirillales bacterium]